MTFVFHLIAVLVWTSAADVSCGGHKLSTASVSSLLELAGFAPSCVSRALAQCHEDSNPQSLQQSPLLVLAIHNMTLDIQQLSRSVQELHNTTETLPLQTLLQTLQSLTQSPPQALTPKTDSSRPRHCLDLKKAGDSGRGVRRIYPFPCCPNWVIKVFCDQETDGGGWTVIQRRDDLPPYQDFYLTYIEYEKGFGDVEGEHWLGLENIHHLTTHSLQELRIDLSDFENATRWAKYGFFHVRDSSSGYVMNCGRYKGAWWYKSCHESNLNGKYLKGTTESFADGVIWKHWRGLYYSLRSSEMKIRPSAYLRT